MKITTYFKAIAASSIFASSFMASFVFAANLPNLTLGSSGGNVQAIVSGADANAPVTFYYPSGTAQVSANIGTTDTYGNLTVAINPASYNLSAGTPVYVKIDGIQSFTATWPSASVSSASANLYLSQTALTVPIGQSSSVTVSNITGSLSLSGNNNPSVATVNLNGNTINVNGIAAGTSVVTVCDSGDGNCATINVTVQPSSLTTQGIYLNPNNLTLSLNQSQNISITGYGSGPYYVSSNSNSNTVSAVINGSNLIVDGLTSGSSNITVCASSGQCGTAFINVASNGTTVASTNLPLALSSFSISSGNQGNSFLVGGNTLTMSFTANQSIISPSVSINGGAVTVNGSGNGPYTAVYMQTGSEAMPMPIIVSFSNSAGATVREYFWTSASATSLAPVASTPVATTANCPVGYSCAAAPVTTTTNCPVGYSCAAASATTASVSVPASSYTFNNYLYMGMNNIGDSDPDVVALQNRLTKDGFFSGASTGYFGPVTKAAVQAYQAAHGLNQLGVVGPSTRNLLNQGI